MALSHRAAGPARGILSHPPARSNAPFEHERVLPTGPIAAYVAHYWWVRWDLPAAHEAATLPHPCVHWVVEWRPTQTSGPRAELVGVQRRRFTRILMGRGIVFGIKFRPGVYRTFTGDDPRACLDQRQALADCSCDVAQELIAALTAEPCLTELVAVADRVLARACPGLPPEVAALRDLIEQLEHDHDCVRVEQAAARAGLPVRTLERRFRCHVGVGPKWVIRRYRLIEALESLKTSPPNALAALAARLGYSDQAHFSRDFKSLTGIAPGAWHSR